MKQYRLFYSSSVHRVPIPRRNALASFDLDSRGSQSNSHLIAYAVSHIYFEGVDLGRHGQRIKGIEIIGHERPFGAEPSEEIKSRFYSNMGDTLDYVYELEGDTFTVWGGEKGSPAYARGAFSEDGNTGSGQWVYPGGGYRFTMTRVE